MTLNATGPISLGGSVTGESIAIEVEQGPTNVISMNDTAVRKLGGTTSGAITVPLNFWGRSYHAYFYTMFVKSGASLNITAMTIDSSGYGALLGASYVSGATPDIVFDRIGFDDVGNSTGGTNSTHAYYATQYNGWTTAAIDSSGNVYAFNPKALVIFKFNSSGAFTSICGLNSTGGLSFTWPGMILGITTSQVMTDSLGNVYVSQQLLTIGTTTYLGAIIKLNSSFVIQEAYAMESISGSTSSITPQNAGASSNTYSTEKLWGYSVQRTISGSNYAYMYIQSGTKRYEFSRNFGTGSVTNIYVQDMCFNSTGTVIYVAFEEQNGNQYIAKIDHAAGAVSWIKQITTGSIYRVCIAMDSSDNLYIAYGNGGATVWNTIIAKVNSSDVVQWSRTFSGARALTPNRIRCDNTNVYISIRDEWASPNAGILKVPVSGGNNVTFTLNLSAYSYASSLTTLSTVTTYTTSTVNSPSGVDFTSAITADILSESFVTSSITSFNKQLALT